MPSYVREDEKINKIYAKKTASLITIIFGGFVFLCLISAGTWFGGFGELLNNFFLGVFGNSAYPIFALILIISFLTLFGKQVAGNTKCFVAVLFLIFFTIMIVHLSTTTKFFNDDKTFTEYMDYCYNSVNAEPAFVTGGGAFFGMFIFAIAKYLGISGAYILIALLFLATVVFVVNYVISRRKIKTQTPQHGNRRKEYPVDVPEFAENSSPDSSRPRFYPHKRQNSGFAESQTVVPVQNKLVTPQGEMFVANIVNEQQYIERMRAKSAPVSEEVKVEDVAPVSYLENFQSDLVERKKYAMPSKKFPIDDNMKTVLAEEEIPEQPKAISPILADFYASKKELPKEEKAKEVSNYRININEVKKQFPQSEPIISAKKYAERKNKEYYENKKPVQQNEPVQNVSSVNEDSDFLFKSIYERKMEDEERRRYEEMEREIENLSNDETFEESIDMDELIDEAEQLRTETKTEKYFNKNVFESKNSNFEETKSNYQMDDLEKEIKNYLNLDAVKNKNFSLSGSKNSQTASNESGTHKTVEELKNKSPFKKIRGYVKPSIELLEKSVYVGEELQQENLEKSLILEETLRSFRIDAEVRGITQGPTVTRYELYVGTGVSVKKILAISDDIAMRLEAEGGIRIQAPIPGKNLLGIEVPNRVKQIVRLRDIIESKEFENRKSNITFALGKDIAGQNMVCDLSKMPHLLIAGSTGGGKSACIHSLIISLIYDTSPEDLRFILIDPKRVEFSNYNGLPHLLLENVIVDPKKALSSFNWAINEMERRYELFQELQIRDIGAYNELADEHGEARMPKIVIIVDEVADLLLSNKNELEEKIMKLTQKARAAGIHLVLATQRPSVDVITGVIKSNLPSRIALKVPDPQSSKTIINIGGAEKLLGYGDMLFFDAHAPVRIQGAFVDTPEIKKITRFIIENNESDFNQEVEKDIQCVKEEILPDENDDDAVVKEKELDAYFVDALRMGIEKEAISLSMVQRKFSVGYSRAGKIIDTMEELGYISEANGAKPRRILISREQFEELYGNLD